MIRPQDWLQAHPRGLYCVPGDFWIDPSGAVDRAVFTHGHADHARPGHGAVLATRETIAIAKARYGDRAGQSFQELAYGAVLDLGGVTLRLLPAGHVLGSAQVVLEHAGQRVVVSGDYKRRRDPTCPSFEVVPCDVFITEATFGLPVFRHPPADQEIARLLASVTTFPDRCHLVGVYSLGKCQRVIRLLREAGHDGPLYLHGAMEQLCGLYEAMGVGLGDLRPVIGTPKAELAGQIVLCPPGSLADRWSRRLPDPVTAAASGWMRVRARARQHGAELPLIISDHADWDELVQTLDEMRPGEVWVTHGREDALVHHATTVGIPARALRLVGREDGEDG
ncbi:MAG: ligase-associated DNA damage response exonuclease [Pseudomonadota bacterium]|nr:ligase-associated DNA damage response exonuclease [Pseudomonadota bacterium]